MNGAQQRQHRRATDTLAQVITETQGAVVERFEEMEASFAAMSTRLDEMRTDLERNRQNLNVAFMNHHTLDTAFYNFRHLPFRQRLRWLFKGI